MNGIADMFVIVVITVLLIYFFYDFWFLFRSSKVMTFRYGIADLESKRRLEAIKQGLYVKFRDLSNKHSYNDMIYSIKPLKLKYWFTEEEINYLTTPIER